MLISTFYGTMALLVDPTEQNKEAEPCPTLAYISAYIQKNNIIICIILLLPFYKNYHSRNIKAQVC